MSLNGAVVAVAGHDEAKVDELVPGADEGVSVARKFAVDEIEDEDEGYLSCVQIREKKYRFSTTTLIEIIDPDDNGRLKGRVIKIVAEPVDGVSTLPPIGEVCDITSGMIGLTKDRSGQWGAGSTVAAEIVLNNMDEEMRRSKGYSDFVVVRCHTFCRECAWKGLGRRVAPPTPEERSERQHATRIARMSDKLSAVMNTAKSAGLTRADLDGNVEVTAAYAEYVNALRPPERDARTATTRETNATEALAKLAVAVDRLINSMSENIAIAGILDEAGAGLPASFGDLL
jgi:hypothetical protein